MIRARKITTLEELDEILPLIEEFHALDNNYRSLFTKSGYYAWLVGNFPNMGIWVGYDETNKPIGYLMAAIQFTFCKKECVVHEAYCKVKDDVVDLVWKKVMDWANKNDCHLLSCYTIRDKAMIRKYGFTLSRRYLTKKI